jgi:hypothetical protein
MGDTLCAKCSVLSLNDRVLRDFVGEGDGIHLPDRKLEHESYKRLNELLKLDYTHSDVFPNLPGLAASAEAGCAFCKVLREETLRNALPEPCTVTYHLRYLWNPPCAPEGVGLYMLLADLTAKAEKNDSESDVILVSIAFSIESAQGTKSESDASGHVLTSPETCRNWLRTILSPPSNVLCDENVAWIREELENDEASHGQHTQSDFLPMRLIDVEAEAHAGSVQLVTTLAMPSRTRYLALSYCWGEGFAAARQLKTTWSTLRRHLQRLPSDQITNVVHDAIKVAQALRVRYLWVDAICIIQDDIEDWARESRRMGLVYTNAYATICALASSSCLEGFLIRTPTVRVHFKSGLRPQVEGLLHICRQPALDRITDEDCSFDSFRYLDSASSAWNSRAWVYQEERLSKRQICFGTSRLHLALSNKQVTEGNRDRYRDPLSSHQWPSSFHDEHRQFIASGDAEILQNSWLNATESVSQKKLSDQQDRFPAVSGLVRLIAEALGDTYVAGIWCKDLLRGLLWKGESRVVSNQPHYLSHLSRPGSATYTCPSWSWAHTTNESLSYHVSHKSYQDLPPVDDWNGLLEHSLRSECRSLNAWSQPENAKLNPYGRITDARLDVEARVAPLPSILHLIPDDHEWLNQAYQVTTHDGSTAVCELDWRNPDDNHDLLLEDVLMMLLASAVGGVHRKEDLVTIVDDMSTKASTCIDPKVAEDYDTERNAWGLLIHPIEDGKFVRIGRFTVRSKLGGLRAFQGCEWKAVALL